MPLGRTQHRARALALAAALFTVGASHAQTAKSPPAVSKEPGSWGRGQIDAGGRYAIGWLGRVVARSGAAPNSKILFLVEATDNVNPERGTIFRGKLEVACGSRVIRWMAVEVMKLDYLDDLMNKTGNPTEFTPSTTMATTAWETACGKNAAEGLVFDKAIEAAVKDLTPAKP